jgi:hypothetical protein
MCNDLTEFELDWLLELALNGAGEVPRAITENLRDLGYAEITRSGTRVTDKGRSMLMAGLQVGSALPNPDRSMPLFH